MFAWRHQTSQLLHFHLKSQITQNSHDIHIPTRCFLTLFLSPDPPATPVFHSQAPERPHPPTRLFSIMLICFAVFKPDLLPRSAVRLFAKDSVCFSLRCSCCGLLFLNMLHYCLVSCISHDSATWVWHWPGKQASFLVLPCTWKINSKEWLGTYGTQRY